MDEKLAKQNVIENINKKTSEKPESTHHLDGVGPTVTLGCILLLQKCSDLIDDSEVVFFQLWIWYNSRNKQDTSKLRKLGLKPALLVETFREWQWSVDMKTISDDLDLILESQSHIDEADEILEGSTTPEADTDDESGNLDGPTDM